ncbi:alpha/beta fold hydrolase [Candidatus Fermentibacteria bacterium]|nr:alpha/beta fold hydrolase [Candidatus Fermentibacteria bacterium]
MLLKILVPIVALYAALVLLAFIFQSRLIYFPEQDLIATPSDVGLNYEDLTLTTSDGVAINAWFVPSDVEGPVVLFCHGNAGNISHRLDTIQLLHDLGLSVLIFDYRGYGNSEGSLSEEGTYRDAEAAWSYLTNQRQVAPRMIVLFGRSLGAPVAAHLATHHDPGALIVESAFTSISDVGAKAYPFLPVRLISRYDYSTVDLVENASCPVLVVHSPGDEMIPFQHGRAIYQAAPEPKAFLELIGSHNEGFLISGTVYTGGLDAFIREHLPRVE